MATSTEQPRNPVENWEQVRDEWVAALESLVAETETWAHQQDWGTLRESKTITEDRLGPYEVPRLLIHGMFGRILLDPVARFVPGVEGLVDLFRIPSWDGLLIARTRDGWFLIHEDAEGPRSPWTEETLVEAARRLTAAP